MPPWPACLSYSHSRQLNYNCSCLIPAKRSWTTCTCPHPSHLHESPDAAPSGEYTCLHLNTASTLGPHSEIISSRMASLISQLEIIFHSEKLLRQYFTNFIWMWHFSCESAQRSNENGDSNSVGLTGGLRLCILNMLTHDANNSGLWIALWVTSDPQSYWHMGITWPAY